jgi:hypothetical protein
MGACAGLGEHWPALNEVTISGHPVVDTALPAAGPRAAKYTVAPG